MYDLFFTWRRYLWPLWNSFGPLQDQKRAEKVSKRVNAIQEVNESVSLLTQLLQDYDGTADNQSNAELVQVNREMLFNTFRRLWRCDQPDNKLEINYFALYIIVSNLCTKPFFSQNLQSLVYFGRKGYNGLFCVTRICTSAVRRWDPHCSDWQVIRKTTTRLSVSITRIHPSLNITKKKKKENGRCCIQYSRVN